MRALGSAVVESLSGQRLSACYQCGNCSAGCPMASWMDQLPNQLIRRMQLGLDVARFEAPFVCASCQTCGIRCPKGIDVPAVMEALRVARLRRGDDYLDIARVSSEERANLPPIALVAAMRKGTG